MSSESSAAVSVDPVDSAAAVTKPKAKKAKSQKGPATIPIKKKASVKKTGVKKSPKKVAKEKPEGHSTKKNVRGLTDRQQKVIDFLAKKGATSSQAAIARDKVWEMLGGGQPAKQVCAGLRKSEFIAWSTLDEEGKTFYLTAAGKKLVSK